LKALDGEGERMEFNQLRYVLRVAEHFSFSRAAISLSVSQPTITQQIGKLETEIGVSLFDRTTRSVSLTNAGRDFITYATKILNAVDDLQYVMQSYHSATCGTICIGILQDAILFNISQFISGFSATHENILVEVNQSSNTELVRELLDHKRDLAFISPTLLNKRVLSLLDCQTLIEDEICLATSSTSALNSYKNIFLHELSNFDIMLSSEFKEVSAIVHEAILKQEFSHHNYKHCSQLEELIKRVITGQCISFLPMTIIKQYKNLGMISIPLNPPLKINISLAMSNDRRNLISSVMFYEYVVSQLEKMEKS